MEKKLMEAQSSNDRKEIDCKKQSYSLCGNEGQEELQSKLSCPSSDVILYKYLKDNPFNEEFERVIVELYPKLYVESVRHSCAFRDVERLKFCSGLVWSKDYAADIRMWESLVEEEGKLWNNVENLFSAYVEKLYARTGENESLRLPIALLDVIIWMETENFEHNEDETVWGSVYSLFIEKLLRTHRDIVGTMIEMDSKSAKELFVRGKEVRGNLRNSNTEKQLFAAMRSWVLYMDGVYYPYSKDDNIRACLGKNALYLQQNPQSLYQWKLDGQRYKINNLYHYQQKAEIAFEEDLENGMYQGREEDLKDPMNEDACVRLWKTKLLLNDLCLTKICWKRHDMAVMNMFNLLIGLSANRYHRYLLPLLIKRGMMSRPQWEKAYGEFCHDVVKKRGFDAFPSVWDIYSKEELLGCYEGTFHVDKGGDNYKVVQDRVKMQDEILTQFCFKVNDENFDRFNLKYDVSEKPFLQLGNSVVWFSPTLVLAMHDWFYGAAQKILVMLSKPENKKIIKELSDAREEMLAQNIKTKISGCKVETFSTGNSEKSGDADIIAQDDNTMLLIQLKCTKLRTHPGEAYDEIVNVDRKAVRQLNDYVPECNSKRLVKWYVSTSYENTLKRYDGGVLKVNYFDLICLLGNTKDCASLDELVSWVESDILMKEVYKDFPNKASRMVYLYRDSQINESLMILANEIYAPVSKPFQKIIQLEDNGLSKALEIIVDNDRPLETRRNTAEMLAVELPDCYLVWDVLADIYTNTKNFDNAINCAKKALEIMPDDPFLLRNYFVTLRKKREASPIIMPISDEEKRVSQRLKEYYFIDYSRLS
jgi:tetratricopeptide (TPR) repeat protein